MQTSRAMPSKLVQKRLKVIERKTANIAAGCFNCGYVTDHSATI